MTDNGRRWVGIDVHCRRSQIAAIDEHGELTISRRITNDDREAFLELLGDPHQTLVALEATYGWEWLAELLQEAGYDVHLAHPLRTRAIAAARVKTDAVDAKTLAHLLRTGLLPEAYIAPPELRDLRELLRHRAVLDQDAHRGQEPRARPAGPPRHPPRARRSVRQSRPRVPGRSRVAGGLPPAP
jgi:transposase